MPQPTPELASFMVRYEAATNRHDFAELAPLIADDATYWFTDGSHRGIAEIRAAIERTFATILDERYTIEDVEWVVVEPDSAVCRYRFSWNGLVDGRHRSGKGRGTNVLLRRCGSWQIFHEHLSQ